MIIRRELPGDVDTIRAITKEAFGRDLEADIVDCLRVSLAWIPELSLVATGGDQIIGHVVCSRADIGGEPVLALGPISVRIQRQRAGVGSALMHAVLGAADALDEPLVGLLGSPDYYGRFGFEESTLFGVLPQDPQWGRYFQVRRLTAFREIQGTFAFPAAFDQAS